MNTPDWAAWDSLFPAEGFFSASAWCRHAAATADLPPVHHLVTDAAGYAGALSAYPLDEDSPYVFCRTDRVIADIAQQLTGSAPAWAHKLLPALGCGGRNPAHTSFGLRPGLDAAQQRSIVDELVMRAERSAVDLGLASIGYLYVDEDNHLVRDRLRHAGYVEIASDVAFVIRVQAFDDYLAGFSTRNRREIRRELRLLDGIRYRESTLDPEIVDRLVPLEMSLYARHGTPADPEALRRVIRSIAVHLGPAARVVLAEVDGVLAGFVLVLQHHDHWYARQTGFDYARQGRLPLYFGLVYYELMRRAWQEGITAIHYGTGSSAAKLARGCRPVGQFAYVKAFAPKVHTLLQQLSSATG